MTARQAFDVVEYFWERAYPYLLAGVGVYLCFGIPSAQKLAIATDLASPILNVFAIIVGFVATVVTFLLTAQTLPVIAKLRPTTAFRRLIGYHWGAVLWGFLATIISIVLLASCKTLNERPLAILFEVWVFSGAAAMLMFFRVFRLLRKLLQLEG